MPAQLGAAQRDVDAAGPLYDFGVDRSGEPGLQPVRLAGEIDAVARRGRQVHQAIVQKLLGFLDITSNAIGPLLHAERRAEQAHQRKYSENNQLPQGSKSLSQGS